MRWEKRGQAEVIDKNMFGRRENTNTSHASIFVGTYMDILYFTQLLNLTRTIPTNYN